MGSEVFESFARIWMNRARGLVTFAGGVRIGSDHSDHVASGNAVLPDRVATATVPVPIHERLPHVVRNLLSWTSVVNSPSLAFCALSREPLPPWPVSTHGTR